MTEQTQSALLTRLELIFWLFTAIIVIGVLYPIISVVENYQFLVTNVLFIVIFITLARYIFLLKHTFLAKRQVLKAVLAFLCLPMVLWIINEVNFFQTFLDEEGATKLVGNLPLEQMGDLANYINTEMVFFGTAAGVTTLVFCGRMLTSIWTLHNRGYA